MQIVSFGDLNLDYYIRDNLVAGINIGGTSMLTLLNLSDKFNKKAITVSGCDIQSDISKEILSIFNVNHINEGIAKKTKLNFVKVKYTTEICPFCDRRINYESKLELDYILNNIEEDDILIIDSLDELNTKVVNNTANEKYLILKCIESIMYYDLDDLKEYYNKFELILFNVEVIKYIIKKFDIDEVDILNIFGPKMIIINKDKQGLEFIYNENIYEKDYDNYKEPIDISGTSESIFAKIIETYLNNNKELDDKILSIMFMRGQIASQIVQNRIGGLAHLSPNYKIENYTECICKKISVKKA